MLDLVDETLNQMSLFVKMFIVVSLFSTPGGGWNNHLGLILSNNQVDEFIRIIPLVGDQSFKLKVNDQRFGLSDVVALTGAQDKS